MSMEARIYSDAPEINFDSFPEVAAFQNEPTGMYVNCPGKHGYLKLVFKRDTNGKYILADLDRRVPLVVQRALYFDKCMPEMPCIYIQSSGGPNVDGDRYGQDFILEEGAMAHIATAAATKLAEMKDNYSAMQQTITLAPDSYLEYMPEPVIPCKNTRYISDTSLIVDETATLFYSEVYMPGRKYYGGGEVFQYDMLSICTHAERPDGQQLFREKFIIEPKIRNVRKIGTMGHFDVFGNIIVLCPREKADAIYEQADAVWNMDENLAWGISFLPNEAGLIFKVLGMETGPVKKAIRNFCSTVRMNIKGRPLPEEFPWR